MLARALCGAVLRAHQTASSLAGPRLLRAAFSSDSDALKNAEKMVEILSKSPQLQSMMMAAMPAPLRSPDMFKQLLGDPAMKQRIAQMIANKGMAIPQAVLDKLNPEALDDTFARAGQMGLNPAELFQKLVAYPGLLAKLREPKVMSAFMDIASNPANRGKYANDPETLEVVSKVQDILAAHRPSAAASGIGSAQHQASTAGTAPEQVAAGERTNPRVFEHQHQQEQQQHQHQQEGTSQATSAPSPASASPPDQPSSAAIPMPPPPGQSATSAEGQGGEINSLVALLSSHPDTAHHCANPHVLEALQAVHKSPWKTVKYVLDRQVMAAFGDLKKLMQGKPVK